METAAGRRFAIATALAGLTGCAATFSESQCSANDWYATGYSDGSTGHHASRLVQRGGACLEHGVVPDRPQYAAGWNDGIQAFCTRENGFTVGESGASYERVCPASLEADFREGYSRGHAVFVAEYEVSRLESAIDKRSARIREMQHQMQYAVDVLTAPDTATTDRLFLLERTKSLSEEQGRLRAEIERLNAELADKRIRLEALRQTLAYGS
jgi:hypothetical protein